VAEQDDGALRPRNGHTLIVGIVARISGGPNQKELSLDDQTDHGKAVVADLYVGPDEYRVIATTGKGERLDRPELATIEAMLRSRDLDLLVCEDLGRLVRGAEAAWLCGIAVDHGTRVIAPNDAIDTAEDGWEEAVIQACRDHVGHNHHLSRRVKQKLMNRFVKFGGATARETLGYRKPRPGAPYGDWTKDDAVTPVYAEMFRRLRETLCYATVAQWLNRAGVPTGKYARRDTWDGPMVRNVAANTILKGLPARGKRHTAKHHETGRRKSVMNPKGPKFYPCPHLIHIDPVEFDEVNALLRQANVGFGRKPVAGKDPRAGIPRKRTAWPGQHVVCGVCGRLFYWGGHGQTTHMMAPGSATTRAGRR
jgi:site-specific DNA recombinase